MAEAVEKRKGWQVHLSVSAIDGGMLLEAAGATRVVGGARLISSLDSEIKELVLFSRENDPGRARAAVLDVYQRLRRVAGLDAQPARVVSLERSPPNGKSPDRLDVTLLDEAARVLDSE